MILSKAAEIIAHTSNDLSFDKTLDDGADSVD